MTDFYFDTATSQAEAEAAIEGFAAAGANGQPVFGARATASTPVSIAFANRAMLALFNAADPDTLAQRLFLAGDPGAKRLDVLVHKAANGVPRAGGAPRLERLRFYFGSTIQMLTFACRWYEREGSPPLFAATVLDAPAYLVREGLAAIRATKPAAPEPLPRQEPVPPLPVSRESKPVRFLWRTDAQDRFTEVTPPLAGVVGRASADIVGKTIDEVSESLHLDPAGQLAQAVAKRETWSSIEVPWPIAGTEATVPVGLGALPAFDRNRVFEGFHGFGVIYVDRALPSPAEGMVSSAPAKATPEEIKPQEKTEEVQPAISPYDAENVVFLRPPGHVAKTPPADTAPEASSAPAEEPHGDIQEDHDVPIQEEPLSKPDLSDAEQNAFNEIARALTSDDLAAKGETAPDPDEGAAEETPAEDRAEPETQTLAEISEALAQLESSASHDAVASEAQPSEPEALLPSAQELSSPQETPSEMELLTRNAKAVFSSLNAGVLVSRNEEAIFVNRYLLDLLGYQDLDALHRGGGIPRLLSQPAPAGSTTVQLVARNGNHVPMIAREQCVEWDHLPATLLILHPTQTSEIHSGMDAKLAHYEAESRELNAILDTATDGVAVLDADGRIVMLNRSGEALFGYDQNEVVGEPFSLLFDAESRGIAEDYLEGLKTHSVKSLLNDGREIVGRARQGGPIPIFMTLGRVSSSHADDKDLKFCALLRDMTHWKKVEQDLNDARKEAERTSAAKSDFLAKVSHEIRTPLNAILGFAEVIMDERFGPIGNDRYKDYLKDIHMSGAHVMSLVNDLLDLSKIEAGKLELDFHEVDANRIISECVALMQPQANRGRVIMRMSLASNLPPINADERSLRQIILNLLSNAVKFNEPGGQVIVATTWNESGRAVIRIRDTGIGMSEEDIETALEPFRQLATARQMNGTGLGLPLTKALVEANHAYFSIKSKKQEGTLVEVTFPVMRVSA